MAKNQSRPFYQHRRNPWDKSVLGICNCICVIFCLGTQLPSKAYLRQNRPANWWKVRHAECPRTVSSLQGAIRKMQQTASPFGYPKLSTNTLNITKNHKIIFKYCKIYKLYITIHIYIYIYIHTIFTKTCKMAACPGATTIQNTLWGARSVCQRIFC